MQYSKESVANIAKILKLLQYLWISRYIKKVNIFLQYDTIYR